MTDEKLKPCEIGREVWKEALSDRRGFRQTMDMIDDDIQEEIFEALGAATIAAWNRRSQGWRTDWENAPKEYKRVLVGAIGDVMFLMRWLGGRSQSWHRLDTGNRCEPTHFMEITPPTPVESGE